jgi:hypothetical protein
MGWLYAGHVDSGSSFRAFVTEFRVQVAFPAGNSYTYEFYISKNGDEKVHSYLALFTPPPSEYLTSQEDWRCSSRVRSYTGEW